MKPQRTAQPRALALLLGLLAASAAQSATLQVTVLAHDGKPLADAVVILEPVDRAKRPSAPPPTEVTIAQQGMQFVPAISVVPAGSRITFTNLDRWEHHVRGLPAGLAAIGGSATGGFELRLGGQVAGKPPERITRTIDQAGPIQLGCHLHGSMRGSIYVTDTPWAVKTNADGVATLPDLPEGAARLRIWHADQLLDTAATPVNITPVSAIQVETRIQPRRRRA